MSGSILSSFSSDLLPVSSVRRRRKLTGGFYDGDGPPKMLKMDDVIGSKMRDAIDARDVWKEFEFATSNCESDDIDFDLQDILEEPFKELADLRIEPEPFHKHVSKFTLNVDK